MAYLFVSARGGPLTTHAVYHIVAQAGIAAGLPFPIHPHMLRHACGFYLANKGVDTPALQQYLGHRNIQHAVRYSELTPPRFQDLWDDEGPRLAKIVATLSQGHYGTYARPPMS